ncbi:MAG: thioredoxin-like domain-containing protein [Chitinophagaceae bacterium]
MKKLLLIPALLTAALVLAQGGYEIKVTLKPFKNQYIYLGHYFGKQYPVIDSVLLDGNSQGAFKGAQKLGGGIYIIAYPSKSKFFEILVDKQQHFSVIADTLNLEKKKFLNSPDNDLFTLYQQHMTTQGRQMDSAMKQYAAATSAADSARWMAYREKLSQEIAAYRKQLITRNPDNILSVLLHLTEEPKVPPAGQHPGGKYDSTFAYRYFKDHYWDDINFWDDRIVRTPASLFEDRLDKYFNSLVYPDADSVNKEIDRMMAYAGVSKDLTRYLLVKFINRYLNMKYMWEDAVFVHLFEKYFSQKDYDWLTPQGKKTITDRAYNLMANIMGHPAENIALPDTSGTMRMLYGTTAPYTLVCFWDPTCGHCKELLPVLDSMYRAKWQADGVTIFAVAKETDGTKKDWLDFIGKHHIGDWTHVYYSKEEEKMRINSGIPGYSQLYDIQSFPTLYLLDKDKRIMAKKVTWQQVDEILNVKMKKP